MRTNLWTVALLLFSSTPSFAHPQHIPSAELITRDANAQPAAKAEEFIYYSREEKRGGDLFKRKGGGGGGGKGGGGSSSSGSSSGSSSSGGGSSSSGSSSGKGGVTSSSSSAGGATKAGSGPAPAYGGGRYYGGGATTPYSSGAHSPLGIAPVFLGVGVLSIYPGLWLYGAYSYPYHNPYIFRNHSATRNGTNTTSDSVVTRQESDTTGVEQKKPVKCLCAAYSECGCDDSGNSTFLDQIIGDGNYAALNKTLVNVADVNGTSTILINGTLPNGTTASGGSDSAAGRTIVEGLGWWVMVATVFATCFAI
ncbi:hypothetical protein BCIN_05g00410 [Botrytis cinerea B05.10]|uniref:DUF7732 domain-containing protein n=3 Tax=Botryotinia fuckeliana TaxID=40559 RepID=A0A384JG73_BOTFB|nr:hypothetical protein BCIN_05g00410 [Botrytis cinerea B05.10]ATZ49613.1 hypothetical protein BCIN_05g00410 [Botrytis cinerea B05.10]EMR83802.1 putative glycine-rich protein [Botrytis cinerea BcDW1]CCD56164.1 hypothetical protein BofuT4_P147740.1 [Botrytis cinerea T4]